MPTIGEVYDPMIAARKDATELERLLREAGQHIFETNPDRCPDAEDGYQAARRNLEYYSHYQAESVASEVKEALGLEGTFMTLSGVRIG